MIIMRKYLPTILLLFSFVWQPLLHAEEELLEPDQAFPFAATVKGDMLQAEWNLPKGYYLYRSKIRLTTDTPGISLGEPQLPAGQIKQDEFFGEMEIYHNPVTAKVPIQRDDPKVTEFQLKAVYQGCADIGVCYPPITKQISLNLPAKSGGAIAALGALSESLGVGGGSEDEVLEPDQAFQFSMDVADPNTLMARWQIAPDHYMYRGKISFQLADGQAIQLGQVELPAGEKKHDEFFGDIEIYHNQVEARIPLLRNNPEPTSVQITATYQGCAEITGICYPPIKKTLTLALPAATSLATTADEAPPGAAVSQPEVISEQDQIAASLASGNTLLTILTFFGFGLLLAFTPCVFPMIPILSSIIVGQGENITTRKAFAMSLTYVLAMALTYTVAGVIAGWFGENLQAAFQNPWILGSFAAVFVALSLSMFGFFELQMPSALQSRLTEISNRQQGGTLLGVAVMGFLSALIVGPCVAAPLAGALIYIGQTGDAVLGGAALFALSLGMGAPLIAIGTSAGKLLPRAGGWMDAIKAVFGVLLLAVAIWMLERVVPPAVTMLLWGLLLIISAIYMKALDPLAPEGSGWQKLWKGLGVVLLVIGSLQLIGAAAGGRDYLQPLKGLQLGMGSGVASSEQHVTFKRIKTVADLERELAGASNQGKMVMLDFYADWCIYCKDYEKYVFTDSRVKTELDKVVLLQADVTANDDEDTALLKHVKVTAPPAILFFDKQSTEMRGYRVVGLMNADEFLAHVKQAMQP
ncbi:MAG: protein-disulfide reductase DsbD [Thiohalomonadales bacterium]|nr:protein-disulfide reductase DsbD [Thiohalomonadales bacterium]